MERPSRRQGERKRMKRDGRALEDMAQETVMQALQRIQRAPPSKHGCHLIPFQLHCSTSSPHHLHPVDASVPQSASVLSFCLYTCEIRESQIMLLVCLKPCIFPFHHKSLSPYNDTESLHDCYLFQIERKFYEFQIGTKQF